MVNINYYIMGRLDVIKILEVDKIYLIDCIDGLKQLDDNVLDLVVTSPPYNQEFITQDKSKLLYKDDLDDTEYIKWLTELFAVVNNKLKDTGSFMYNYKSLGDGRFLKPAFLHLTEVNKISNFKIAGEIIWKYAGNFDPTRSRFPRDYEMVYHLVKTDNFKFDDLKQTLSSVWYIPHVMSWTDEKRECGKHPCPYPLMLIRKIILHTTNENDLVLDPFSGSGTTALASKQLNRKYIGFEKIPEYVDIANKRLQQKNLKDLFNNLPISD